MALKCVTFAIIMVFFCFHSFVATLFCFTLYMQVLFELFKGFLVYLFSTNAN